MIFKKKNTFSLKPTKTFLSTLMVAVAVVFVWRGVWNLLDEYLLPDHWVMSNVLSIIVGILILYLPDKDIKELI